MEYVESLKWPVTLIICVTIFLGFFRQAMINLIGRIIRVVFGDKSVELSNDILGTAEEQKKELETPAVSTEMVPAAQVMPPPNEITAEIEQEVETTLKKSNYPPNVERSWLIRAVALLRIQHGHEVVYRLITGSQINVLLLANAPSAVNLLKAREIYDAAAAAFPSVYSNFTFDTWINYPVNMGLIRIEASGTSPNILRITPRGADFLHFLVSNSLTSGKVG